jgi:hypothetical protein
VLPVQSRPSRSLRIGALALGSAAVAVAVTAAPSGAAVSSTVSLSIRASQCSSSYSWAGKNVTTAYASPSWPRGTVRFCAWKYRMADSDKQYDYYLVYASSDYNRSAGTASLGAPAYQYLDSSTSASGGVYGATKSYTSNKSCSQSFAVGVSAGPFSADVTPTVCSGYSVTRSYYGASGAGWTAPKVGGVGDLQSTFYQKVPAGTVPIFTVEFIRPTYTHTWYADLYWKESAGSTKWTAIL